MLNRLKIKFSSNKFPDFIIVGAQKSGTTSLFHYLSQHPQLVPACEKELHFFDDGLDEASNNYKKGGGWYGAHFARKDQLNGGQKTFEATPLYLFHPYSAARIAKLLPATKIIVVLRNPVERAISHYFHERRLGFESLPVLQAMENEDKRLEDSLSKGLYNSMPFIHFSYKTRGLYKEQLVRYFQYFGENQIHIIQNERLLIETDRVLVDLFKFIGVDANIEIKSLERRGVAHGKTGIDGRVYEYLNEYFYKPNQDLYHFLGCSYNW